MGWIEEQFERRLQSQNRGREKQTAGENRFEAQVEGKWMELVNGLQDDVEEYRRLGGDAEFRQGSETECRVVNVRAGAAAHIAIDLSAHTVRYSFESENQDIAVPEGGFFSLRKSLARGADLFSADQRITGEQARRIILEPLLFPNPPRLM